MLTFNHGNPAFAPILVAASFLDPSFVMLTFQRVKRVAKNKVRQSSNQPSLDFNYKKNGYTSLSSVLATFCWVHQVLGRKPNCYSLNWVRKKHFKMIRISGKSDWFKSVVVAWPDIICIMCSYCLLNIHQWVVEAKSRGISSRSSIFPSMTLLQRSEKKWRKWHVFLPSMPDTMIDKLLLLLVLKKELYFYNYHVEISTHSDPLLGFSHRFNCRDPFVTATSCQLVIQFSGGSWIVGLLSQLGVHVFLFCS